MMLDELKIDLTKYASANDAVFLQRFFKTGPGEYGEGDVFIGVRMPNIRKVCAQFKDLSFDEIQELFDSPVHEHRMAAAIILNERYKKSKNVAQKQKIYDLYLLNVYNGRINNWDIIDVTCRGVVGEYLRDKPKKVLYDMAKSDDIWQKRVAIISTFPYIADGDSYDALKLAEILLYDKHDLIQKAVGWTLREVGKRVDRDLLINFLDMHAATMPRTSLRYSIEHLDKEKRQYYLGLKR